eukprot:Nitzschia sp. Nitz4//scaffold107_size73032//19922//25024//NITZ4_005758-RA/size73032-augustus-gene-0.99-mRNA-1//-1//CDS//3329532587//1680//frame0
MRWNGNSNNEASSQLEGDRPVDNEAASTTASSISGSATTSMSSPLGAVDDALAADSSAPLDSNPHLHLGSASHAQNRALVDAHADADDSAVDGDPPYPRRNQQQQQADAGGANDDDGPAHASSSDASPRHNLATASSNLSDVHHTDELDDNIRAALEEAFHDGDDQEVPWKPQATQSTCEFTHTITDYSQKRDSGCKKAEYSATTVDEFGNRWRLIVYVNGNGRASNHHLSLFLQVADADDLPFGWKKAVSYVLTLEHPSGPNQSYAKRNPDKTFKLCPKAIDWGWSQFITSDRIQQEGFVQDDKLVVRASVTVKSSSVSIDLEDAELYLKCAVEEGKPEAVQLCLDQGASVNCQFKDDLYTPLHTACSSSTGDDDDEDDSCEYSDTEESQRKRPHTSGGMRVLQLLLEKGADGNACNKWRETPLLIAANNGHRSAVEALLAHGADPSLCSEAGWSALTFAAHKGYDDIVQLLLTAGAPVNCRVTEDASTPLHKACAGSKPGHLAAVQLLLASNADVHALNKWRETPLLTAANHGQAGAVDALLKAGADPCKCTDTGWSPLSIAAYKGHDDVVKLLLEEGAPTEEADPTLSALLQAATKGLPDTVELLLRHGADHTVTTKKGDTALSILVEQNLIDAAVDMVSEYNASVPRCSRDRKKVQRARLLINLRMKQREREGKTVHLLEEDDDELDDPVEASAITEALSETGNAEANIVQPKAGGSKKKNKKKKISAEQQAKAAEEALLLELEQEDAERQKQEQEASKKSAKKKKKKERERQQKKEQEEKRLAEEKERADKLQKEREAREAKEREERERLAAIRRKEEEEERIRQVEKHQREQLLKEEQRKKELQKKKLQQQQQQAQAPAQEKPIPPAATPKTPKSAVKAANKRPTAVAPTGASVRSSSVGAAVSAKPEGVRPTVPIKAGVPGASQTKQTGKNRGWETNPVANSEKTPTKAAGNVQRANPATPATSSPPSSVLTPPVELRGGMDLFNNTTPLSYSSGSNTMQPPGPGPITFTKSEPILNGFNPVSSVPSYPEVPNVALFRREKLSELIHRCSMARATSDPLGAVEASTVKQVLYRWMVRAAHEPASYLDCVIPSWNDFDKLTSFLQRQFISLSRKGAASLAGNSMASIETLKEAGSAMALLCHNLAKDVAEFSHQVAEKLPPSWTDGTLGIKASELPRNGSGDSGTILIDWSNRAQVYITTHIFNNLRERYVGVPGRFLCAVFTAKLRYDTKHLITMDSEMDFSLPFETKSTLAMNANVSAEVGVNPFTVSSGNVFWGQFLDVDSVFGGVAPFSSTEQGESPLVRHGGSVVVLAPLDNIVASQYIQRMVDLLEAADNGRVPLSFAVFLRSETFLDGNHSPTANDLFALEPRLRERSELVVRTVELAAGCHSFYNDKTGSLQRSQTGSLFVVLQNAHGKNHLGFTEATVHSICRSLDAVSNLPATNHDALPVMSDMSFSAPEFVPTTGRSQSLDIATGGLFGQPQSHTPISPMTHNNIIPEFGAPASSDFGVFPMSLSNTFSSAPVPSRPTRPSRLFDLVDDGEDEHGTADVVSGMLGNLNMDDLFSQNPHGTNLNGEVDIEAISLMGITGLPPSTGTIQPRRQFG